jgi:Alternative complex III, ActD subunit
VYLIGEFRDKETLTDAIRALGKAGLGPDDLALFSEEPVTLPKGVLDRPSSMSLISVLGGIGFGGIATAFVYYSQHNYVIVTGGMPVFSFWATGVITYEMCMLGAMVTAFLWFLWESGLLRRRDAFAPTPAVDPGAMCLRVRCRSERTAETNAIMERNGAINVVERSEA